MVKGVWGKLGPRTAQSSHCGFYLYRDLAELFCSQIQNAALFPSCCWAWVLPGSGSWGRGRVVEHASLPLLGSVHCVLPPPPPIGRWFLAFLLPGTGEPGRWGLTCFTQGSPLTFQPCPCSQPVASGLHFLSSVPALLNPDTGGLCPEFVHHGLHLPYLKQRPAATLPWTPRAACQEASCQQGMALPSQAHVSAPAVCVKRTYLFPPAAQIQTRSRRTSQTTQGCCSEAGSVPCSPPGLSALPCRTSQCCLGCWRSGEPGKVPGYSVPLGCALHFHTIPRPKALYSEAWGWV